MDLVEKILFADSFYKMTHQLPLAVQLNDNATFSDFCWNANPLLKNILLQMFAGDSERFLYIWGSVGSGKSHVLQACCQAMDVANRTSIYLPLSLLKTWGPQVLEGMSSHDLVAFDDIDVIAGDKAWEEALFHLYNRIRDKESSMCIMSAQVSPSQSPIQLPDLHSRLTWGLVMQLQSLDDSDKVGVLQLHAKKRGFDLSTQVCHYLMNHCARNMQDLHRILNELDKASLIAQRKITIPFVKDILENQV